MTTKQKPIIFLDVDGVLNTRTMLSDGDWDSFDPDRCTMIRDFAEKFDCDIVLSSAWRLFHDLAELRDWFKLDIIDHTPTDCPSGSREVEIKKWLEVNGREDSPIIIFDDDTFDLTTLMEFVIATNFETGLLPFHIDMAEEVLKEQLK